MSTSTYPVRVDAHLDPGLTRWLWLVKWLLALPHYVVLAFLWVAFVVLSAVAWVAILVTGRYPRSIFDFNVGVLRWTWRVGYYAYGALGTDRYPPFTLAEVPDFPAHLEVPYPEHLSRGLALVKWWLLAVPHYLVVGLLVGGGYRFATDTSDPTRWWGWGGGLIGLLVLVAGVLLLFTGRYPQQLFDLVLGLNRWVLRVAAYAGLMTDAYPPFRLDLGGDDPTGPAGRSATLTVGPVAPGAPAVAPEPAAAPAPAGSRGPSAGRTVLLVVGALLAVLAFAVASGAVTLGVGAAALRDDDGYVMTGEADLLSSTAVITSPDVPVQASDAPRGLLGRAKVAVSPRTGRSVFVGIAATSDVRRWLAGVAHTRVVEVRGLGRDVLTQDVPGRVRVSPPGQQTFWAAQASGSGRQELTWPPRSGSWTVVVMNADGSRGVDVAVAAGARVPALGWLVGGLGAVAVVTAVLAVLLLWLGLRGSPGRGRPPG